MLKSSGESQNPRNWQKKKIKGNLVKQTEVLRHASKKNSGCDSVEAEEGRGTQRDVKTLLTSRKAGAKTENPLTLVGAKKIPGRRLKDQRRWDRPWWGGKLSERP